MAALDDEELPSPYGATEAASPYDTIAVPPTRSALGTEEDYGGGEDQPAPVATSVIQALVERGTRTPAKPGSGQAILRQVVEAQLARHMQRQAQPQPAKIGYGGFDANALQSQFDPNGPELVADLPGPEKKKGEGEGEGYGDALVRGFLRAGEDAKATGEILKGNKPKTSKITEAEFEKPIEMGDFTKPIALTKKLVFGLSKSSPELAGMLVGGAVGTTAGTAIGGPIGGTLGGIGGAAVGTGSVAAVQAIGTAYAHELENIGDDPTPEKIDQAWNNAITEASKAAGVSAASIALFVAGKPLGGALKTMLSKPVMDAAGKKVAQTAGVPLQVGVQAVGQPVIPMAGQAAANVAEGKPVGEGVLETAPGSIANVALDALGRVIGGRFMGAPRKVIPGVTEEQKAALQQPPGTQGELPLEGGAGVKPPPVGLGGQMEMPLVGGAGERPPVQGEQLRLPDITGPGRQPLGDQTYTPPTPPPVQPELPGVGPPTAGAPVRGPQLDLAMEGGAEGPARMIGGQRIPESAPFVDDGATSIGAAARPVGRVGLEPEVTPGVTDLAAQPDLFRTPVGEVRGPQMALPGTEDVNVGGTRVPMNAPVLETARRAGRDTGARSPIGRLTEPEPQPDQRPTQAEGQQDLLGMRTAEGWTFERDHTGPGYVVKNADGNVISVGDTQEQALRFARERHPDQVAAKTTPRMTEDEPAQPAGRQINRGTGPTLREAEAATARRVTEEVPAEQAKPAVSGTKEQLVAAEEKAPPAKAETAKTEPTAQEGGDAVPKPPEEQTFRLPKTGHTLTGKQGTGTVDPARPFVLSWQRNLLDAQGRPVRGASHTFHYADEASARTDLAAVRAAGGQNAMLREFTKDLSSARDITEGAAPQTRQQRLKAAIAELDARNAPDKDYQALLSTGSKSMRGFATWRDKVEAAAEGRTAAEQRKATAQTKLAEVKEKATSVTKKDTERGAPTTSFRTERGSTYEVHDDGTTTRDKSLHPEHGAEDVGLKPRSDKTIYVDTHAQAASLSGAGVSGAYGHRLVLENGKATLAWKTTPEAKWGTHKSNRDIPFTTEPAVGKHPVEMWGRTKDVPGAAEAYSGQHAGNRIVEVTKSSGELHTETGPKTPRTKSGAYVTPGEAAEALPPRKPLREGVSKLGEEAAEEGQVTEREGLVSEATRKMADVRLDETPHPVTPELESGRKAAAIIGHVLKRGMSLAGAVEAFGKRAPGAPGPKPNFETLSQYVRERLRTMDTTDAEAAITKAMNEAAAKLRQPGANRTKISSDLNKLIKQLDEVKNEPARLREMLPDIEALERGENIAGSRQRKSSMQQAREFGAARAIELLSKLSAVNERVLQHLENAGENGVSLHRVLDDFISDRAAARLTPQLNELARVLRRVVPDTILRKADLDEGPIGAYHADTGEISIHPESARAEGNAAVTLLHETIHRGTADYITHLYRTEEINLTPQELAHKSALEAIRAEIHRVLNEGDLRTRTLDEGFELEYSTRMYDTPFITGPHELATQLLSTPEIHNILSRTTASPEFRAALDRVGMGISSKGTIWDGFKRVLRNILGIPERLDSVLDYVMRPLTEIVETGGKFRPKDVAEARQIARDNLDTLAGSEDQRTAASMKRIWNAAKNIGDPRGRALLRGAYQGGNLQAIHDMIKPYIPAVTAHRDVLDRVKHASDAEAVREITTYDNNGRAITEPAMDKVNRLANQLRESPERPEISNLMSEVQYAEVDVLDPAGNAHLRTQEQLDIKDALQQRFDALSPEGQQIYREHNALRNEWHRADREAKIEEFVETTFEESTPAERLAIKNQMRTRQGVMDVLNNLDSTPIGPMLGNKKALAKVFAESQSLGFVNGNYFGLRRNGEYIVSYGDPKVPSTYGVEHFETITAAQVRKEELHQGKGVVGEPTYVAPREDVSQVFTKSQMQSNKLFQNPEQALGTLNRALETGGITGERAKIIQDLYSTQLIQQGIRAATHTMRREGIRGATEEYHRTLMGDYLAHNSRMGHLKHGVEVNRTLFQAERENQQFRHSGANAFEVALAETGVRELRKRQIPADGDTSSDVIGNGSRALTSWTVASSLIRPAHFFMNTAGAHSAASGLIGGRHGAVAANFAVAKAMAQLTGATLGVARRDAWAAIKNDMKAVNWDTLSYYRERMKKAGDISPENVDLLSDMLDRTNLVNQSRTREMRRMAGPQGYMTGHNYLARAMDVFSAAEHAADSSMRFAIAKAAFVTEFNKNGRHAGDALKYAEQVTRDAMADYNQKSRVATPQGSLGKLAPITTQFRQFGLHMLGVQANLLATGLRDKSPEIRSQARKSLALLHMQHMLWTGVGGAVFGSLPVMAGLGLWDFLHGEDPHTNREWETQSRNAIKDLAGKGVADVFAYGLPMTAGIDAHRSLQFTNLLGIPEWRTHDKEGTLSFAIQMLGPSPDAAAGMVDSAFKILKGDLRTENFAKLAPRIIRDPIEAYQWGTEGLKTTKGDLTIVRPEQFSTGELIAKGIGFIPRSVSDARNARATIDVVNKVSDAARRSLLDKFIRTPAADRKSVMDEIYRYNTVADPAERITGQAIQARIREQAVINAQPNLVGMRGVSRREVPLMEKWTSFARQ